ncbi:MAG: hypothetical protein WCE94_07300 [Candidatus Methanoperedens sp.]
MSREDWFKVLIREFRSGYKKLFEDEKKHISNLDDLTEPCQILSITFDNPPLTKTFFLHLSNVSDETIWEYGPIKPYEAFELFEKIIADPVWDTPLDKDEQVFFDEIEEPIVRTLIERSLMSILRDIQRCIFESHPSSINIPSLKNYFLKKSGVWTFYGDITNASAANIADGIIQNAKNVYENEKMRQKEETAKVEPPKFLEPLEYTWHGAFLFPPVYIGKAPRIPFSERLLGIIWMSKLGTVVFEGKINNRNLIATHNGFVGIEAIRKDEALELLNILVAALLLRGTVSFVIREHEVGDFQYDIATKQFRNWSIAMTPRSSIMNEQYQQNYFFRRKSKLTSDVLALALKDAELYLKDPRHRFYIPVFLESYTHLAESEYKQSFFMSWVIIEKNLAEKWKTILQEKGISDGRFDRLTNTSQWSIDYLIEAMNLQGVTADTDYDILMKLKKRRNNILHGTIKATKEDATEAFSVALGILNKKNLT